MRAESETNMDETLSLRELYRRNQIELRSRMDSARKATEQRMILGKNYPGFPDCSTRYTAAHNSGARTAKQITDIVIHDTESETAESAASWFQNPASAGSSNLVVSDDICFRTLPDLVIPWAAPPFNTQGFHIEIVGFVAWTASEWQAHKKRIENAAYRAAIRCVRYSIPVRFNTANDLLEGKHGITSHANISAAFHQTDHTDPGPNFPYMFFLDLVEWYVQRINSQNVSV